MDQHPEFDDDAVDDDDEGEGEAAEEEEGEEEITLDLSRES